MTTAVQTTGATVTRPCPRGCGGAQVATTVRGERAQVWACQTPGCLGPLERVRASACPPPPRRVSDRGGV